MKKTNVGPYIKSSDTGGTEMSANADLITVETYVQQGKTIENPVCHIWAKCIFVLNILNISDHY